MELKEGMKAPDFTLQDSQGKDVVLSNFREKNVILYFYPKDNTKGCTLEAINFRDNYEEIKKTNSVILGVSKDSMKSHVSFINKYNLPFILLSDGEGKVCELYGVCCCWVLWLVCEVGCWWFVLYVYVFACVVGGSVVVCYG